MDESLKEKLRDLIRRANGAGRGRVDSNDWEDEDLQDFLEEFDQLTSR